MSENATVYIKDGKVYGLSRKPPPYKTKEREEYLKKYGGIVAPAILAADLKLSETTVIGWLRELGLREFSHGKKLRKSPSAL